MFEKQINAGIDQAKGAAEGLMNKAVDSADSAAERVLDDIGDYELVVQWPSTPIKLTLLVEWPQEPFKVSIRKKLVGPIGPIEPK